MEGKDHVFSGAVPSVNVAINLSGNSLDSLQLLALTVLCLLPLNFHIRILQACKLVDRAKGQQVGRMV